MTDLDPATFSLHAQWGPRACDTGTTGRLLASVLRSISDADPRIDFWYRDLDILAASGKLDPTDQITTCTALARDLGDGDPPVLRVGLNTLDEAGAGVPNSELDTVIGSTDPCEPNHVTWALLEAGAGILATPTATVSLLRAWIAITDADWAAISNPDIDIQQPAHPDGPTFGWATYVAHRRQPIPMPAPQLPGATIQPVHRGHLIVLDTPPEQTPPTTVRTVAAFLGSPTSSGRP